MKPELSKEMRMNINKLWELLKERNYKKTELMEIFGVGDRQIRLMIAELAKRRAVIATSDKSGYRVATTKADLADVEHQWKELDSRIKELEERRKPLIRFREKCQ